MTQLRHPSELSVGNVQAIIRWGGALLELAHFQQGPQANEMIDEAATKFKEALKINPRKHDALWCLGNAYTSQVCSPGVQAVQLRRPRVPCPTQMLSPAGLPVK